MKKDKIYELKISEDDDISGIDSISLVDQPAIEVNWVAFKKQQEDFFIPDTEDEIYLKKLFSKGESEEDLVNEGWEVDRVVEYGKQDFTLDPNDESYQDTEFVKVRYKYGLSPNIAESPIIPTTRQFCRDLINKNFVWKFEDISNLQNDLGSSALTWRGSFNCRHRWFQIFYKAGDKIINKASINKGKITGPEGVPIQQTPDFPQPDTITTKTRNNPSPSTIKNLGMGKEDMDYDNNLPAYVDQVSGETIEKSIEFESYTDYPESARNAAKRALDWVEKNGWGSCGTPVGKARASQLAKGEPISEETISRMASFARHAQNKDVPYTEGCGGLMWDAWGGTAGIEWAQNKLEEINKTNMSKQHFQTDEEKKIVVGPAMIPDLKIFRKDDLGNPYYVYFSSDTIKMIAEKYMRNKYIDNNDENHNGKAVSDVYVIESWIKEDNQDKSNKYGFENLPIGTWFVSMKVKNDEVWQRIKKGELNGFSVSGFFEEVAAFKKEDIFLMKVSEILKKVKD
jgi:hypothetical protein